MPWTILLIILSPALIFAGFFAQDAFAELMNRRFPGWEKKWAGRTFLVAMVVMGAVAALGAVLAARGNDVLAPVPTPTLPPLATGTATPALSFATPTPAATPAAAGTLPPPPPPPPPPSEPAIFLEGESGTGDGDVISRSAASGDQTVWLQAGESRTLSFRLDTGARYKLNVRYSNDNFGPLETIAVSVDGTSLGQFVTQDTGDDGEGWNVFFWSDIVGSRDLAPGDHEVVLFVSGGDGFGVEIDLVGLVPVR